MDEGIRWNSVYRMIERALKLRDAVDLFFLNYDYDDEDIDISQELLEKQDWIDLKDFYYVLKPFRDLTKWMEGRASKAGLDGSHGALWETLEAIDVLFKKLREADQFADTHPLEVSEYYSKGIDAARLKLEKYFGLTDATPAYRCAVALHPANKWNYFEIEWVHKKQWISDAKKAVKEAYAQYQAAAETAIPTTNEIIISSDEEHRSPTTSSQTSEAYTSSGDSK